MVMVLVVKTLISQCWATGIVDVDSRTGICGSVTSQVILGLTHVFQVSGLLLFLLTTTSPCRLALVIIVPQSWTRKKRTVSLLAMFTTVGTHLTEMT